MSLHLNSLPAGAWLSIFQQLDYFDLNRIRRVNKFLHHCSQLRQAQEALFLAPFDEGSLKSNFKDGDEIRLHPALFELVVKMERERTSEETFEVLAILTVGSEQVVPANHREWSLGQQNATSPPVFFIKMLDSEYRANRLELLSWNGRHYSLKNGYDSFSGSEEEGATEFPPNLDPLEIILLKLIPQMRSWWEKGIESETDIRDGRPIQMKAATVSDVIGGLRKNFSELEPVKIHNGIK